MIDSSEIETALDDIDLNDAYLKSLDFVSTFPDSHNKYEYFDIEENNLNTPSDSKCFIDPSYQSLIWSIITLLIIIFLITYSILRKTKYPSIIVSRSIPIANEYIAYIIWGFHCGSLIALPWLLIFLFKEIEWYYIMFSPIMMLLNMIGGILDIRISGIFLIIELIVVSFLIYKVHDKYDRIFIYPCKNVMKSFFIYEFLKMGLGFIFISSLLGTSTLSYLIFAPHIRINGMNAFYPSPYYATDYLNVLYKTEGIKTTGGFLACYSLFIFLSVTYGFIMSFQNSYLAIIPFFLLVISTILNNKTIGIILFLQLGIHILYMIFMQSSNGRNIVAAYHCPKNREFLQENCYATANAIFIGDLISFTFVVFPLIGFSNGNYQSKFPWGFYILFTIILMLGVVFHIFLLACKKENKKLILVFTIFTVIFITLGIILIELKLRGSVIFIRAFTYVITSLSWSIMLSFWARLSGFSPVLFKTYQFLVPFASYIVVLVYEGFGAFELVFCIIQLLLNIFLVNFIEKFKKSEIGWAFVSGSFGFGAISAIILLILFALVYLIVYFKEGKNDDYKLQNLLKTFVKENIDIDSYAGVKWLNGKNPPEKKEDD